VDHIATTGNKNMFEWVVSYDSLVCFVP